MSDTNNKIWNRSLDDIMSESFGKYAKYIIQDRALPDIRDGLKPVQRRILFAMNELKILYDRQYKKSARTVGEVIGKYHPHGDSSIYEAMVRMAQEWKNNIPLLDMQGNKGSIDGDSAAAMRYTECRLSKFGQYMMNNIDKETVKFINNFDDTEKEPSVLPSLLPNILINGATGIAAGYATNIPPFNFNEVMDGIIYRINNSESTLKELSRIIKGPDFPTGGIIQGKSEIDKMFLTGRGKFFIRAKIEEEYGRVNKKNKRLIIKEIPYDTNKSSIVKSLDEIRINNELPGFKEVRDDSDKNGISIVLEFDTDKDLEIIKTFLYKKTQLQIAYAANIVLIKNRKPVQAGLMEILDSFIDHINEVTIKASEHDLKKALSRKEILEGLIKAISEIDVLVNLIKSSTSKDEAKQKVQDYFKVNERQSEAIVNLRLYVLTSYDTEKLKKEYDELLLFIDEKEKLISDKNFRNKHICEILNTYKNELGSKRKSKLEDEIEDLEIQTSDIIQEVNGTCIVTRDNYIKFVQDSNLTELDLPKAKVKETDLFVDIFKMSTLDYFVCLTNKGKCITIPAYKIKMTKLRENGIHINDLVTIDPNEKTIFAFSISRKANIENQILIATKQSFIKRMYLEEFNLSKNAKSSSYINLKNDDEVVSVSLINDEYKEIISISEKGMGIKYLLDEIPIVGRTAAGVKNMSLKENDYVASSVLVPNDENFILITSNRGAKRIHINDIQKTSRATYGKRIFQQVESNPYIVNWAAIISGRSSIYLQTENKVIEAKVSDIPISDTSSRMNSFSKIEDTILRATYLNINKNSISFCEDNNFENLLNNQNNKNKIEEIKKSKSKSKKLELDEEGYEKAPEIEIKPVKKEFFIDEKELIFDDDQENSIEEDDKNNDNENEFSNIDNVKRDVEFDEENIVNTFFEKKIDDDILNNTSDLNKNSFNDDSNKRIEDENKNDNDFKSYKDVKLFGSQNENESFLNDENPNKLIFGRPPKEKIDLDKIIKENQENNSNNLINNNSVIDKEIENSNLENNNKNSELEKETFLKKELTLDDIIPKNQNNDSSNKFHDEFKKEQEIEKTIDKIFNKNKDEEQGNILDFLKDIDEYEDE